MFRNLEVFVFFSIAIVHVFGHGFLMEPAARNSMWRFGFRNPPNYNDVSLWCGGRNKQAQNHGRCGVCGDDASLRIQPHMDGNLYGRGRTTQTYQEGKLIDVKVKITAFHRGYFEFRIGAFDEGKIAGDYMGKLNGEILRMVDGSKKTSVPINRTGVYSFKLQLPAKLTCKRCVLQWWYRTGNHWGCEKGRCGMGLGFQENFVNCADVRIV